MIFQNGKDKPLNQRAGTVPDMSGALLSWFQPMIFEVVGKVVDGFLVVETGTVFDFQGVIQPFTDRQLMIKPEGERAWSWFWVHANPALRLDVDMVIKYLGVQYRVMALKDYSLYGYMDYHLIQDYTGAGPTEVTP